MADADGPMNALVKTMETQKTDLTEVVVKARQGSPLAFEQLVERTENLLKKIAFPIVGEQRLADALQETYLLVFRNLHQLREPGAFVPWLSRMCLHVCYKLRPETPHQELKDVAVTVSDESDQVAARVTLNRALNRLERADRDLLILRELLDFSYQDLAYTLRLPVGTVKSKLSTARARLRERLNLSSE